MAINRTKVELKLERNGLNPDPGTTINRTKVELKYEALCSTWGFEAAINRTKVELKCFKLLPIIKTKKLKSIVVQRD